MGLYFSKGPFLKGLFVVGLILGGAYIWWENCITKLIGLANGWWANERKLCVTVLFLPLGAYIWRGDLTEGFLSYRFGGLRFGGAYTWRSLFLEFYSIQLIIHLTKYCSSTNQNGLILLNKEHSHFQVAEWHSCISRPFQPSSCIWWSVQLQQDWHPLASLPQHGWYHDSLFQTVLYLPKTE